MKNYTLEMPYGKIVFRRQCGGFPAEIEVRDFDGALFHLIHNMHSFLSLKTEDDTIFHPFCDSASPFSNGTRMVAKCWNFPAFPGKIQTAKNLIIFFSR
ncbi:MAG: hypothetical protein BWY31_02211 [Lentisphaerae bacterium ADurb.Bin242]|nr:MAG: hypothetical protein BWY31_02211 [Lentisphaerae bacterium ADurb.Bin242]